jgi:hypothetical protein
VPYIEVIKGQVPTASDCAAAIAAVNTTAVEAQYVSLTVCALHSSLGSTVTFALLCFALLCFALLCFALLCFALLCLLISLHELQQQTSRA